MGRKRVPLKGLPVPLFTRAAFNKRVQSIYSNQRGRARDFLRSRSIPAVFASIPSSSYLPYTSAQFTEWLWEKVGLEPFPCPYCRLLIDFTSMSVDHILPITRGGSWDLNNQEPICTRCNTLKGEMDRIEFLALVEFLARTGGFLRSYVESCLQLGPQGKRQKFFSYKGKKAA